MLVIFNRGNLKNRHSHQRGKSKKIGGCFKWQHINVSSAREKSAAQILTRDLYALIVEERFFTSHEQK